MVVRLFVIIYVILLNLFVRYIWIFFFSSDIPLEDFENSRESPKHNFQISDKGKLIIKPDISYTKNIKDPEAGAKIASHELKLENIDNKRCSVR